MSDFDKVMKRLKRIEQETKEPQMYAVNDSNAKMWIAEFLIETADDAAALLKHYHDKIEELGPIVAKYLTRG